MANLPFAIVLAVLAVFALIAGIGAVLVIVVVANRADPDPSGRRPVVVYLFAVAFLTLFVSLFASFSAVGSLCRLIGHTVMDGPGQHPVGDAVARGVVISLLLVLVAGAALLWHLRAGLSQTDDVVGTPAPSARVRQSYVSAVAFVSILIIIGSLVAGLYDVFKIVAPGVFYSPKGRVPPVRALIPTLYLALAATAILVAHLRLTPPTLRPWMTAGRGTGGPAGPAPVTAPPPVDVAAAADEQQRVEAARSARKAASPATKTAAARKASTPRTPRKGPGRT